MTLWLTQMSGPAARWLGTSVKQLAGGTVVTFPYSSDVITGLHPALSQPPVRSLGRRCSYFADCVQFYNLSLFYTIYYSKQCLCRPEFIGHMRYVWRPNFVQYLQQRGVVWVEKQRHSSSRTSRWIKLLMNFRRERFQGSEKRKDCFKKSRNNFCIAKR